MNAPTAHPSFEFLRAEPLPTLHLTLEEYRHRATGARHLHLRADDPHNAFMVAFRTVPMDSTGVAHILEHTVLCGSERFPVRDPFFMMTRRSLNTFMNAFTGADWTGYPFASQNRKDFDNLLQVYLDAVFFPHLDALDFAQEGHRVEQADPADPSSPLVFKGIVFNEMKGAMSSPTNALWQSLTTHLYPTTTYHYNSGGEPSRIPDLSHAQLKAFHASHYHPSNAVFLTYGDIPPAEHQGRFEELALNRFEHLDVHFEIPDERRFAAPATVEEHYALDDPEETAEKTHVVLGWLLGRNSDMEEVLKAHLLSGVLLDNSASPLRLALETSDLGAAPSPLCGLDDSPREMLFCCGLEGSEPEHAAAVEELILGVLKQVAEEGVPKEMVASVLHQLELSQREISGDHYPYGLQLLMHTMGPLLHGGDPAAALEIDPILVRLRAAIDDPAFIRNLTRRWLLENPHRLRLTMGPDPELSARQAREEAERLAAIKATLDHAALRRLAEQAERLTERQGRKDDPERLPKVTIADVPAELKIAGGTAAAVAGMPATWYDQGTNGLIYQELVIELPQLEEELLELLPLFCATLTEVGSGGRDYLATQALQAAVTGGIHARAAVRGAVDDAQRHRGLFVLSGKALARNRGALTDLLRETLEGARFDELKRLRELVAQERADAEPGVVSHGHSLAMTAATSGLTPSAALVHRWRGLLGVRRLKALDKGLDEATALEQYAARLEQLRQRLLGAERRLLVIGEGTEHAAVRAELERCWAGHAAPAGLPPLTLAAAPRQVREAWSVSTQVNFAARAYPAVATAHPDAPALLVLGNFLRDGFLHRVIREQGGAYGGGAGYDGDLAAFRFYSYRDPRLGETLADFDRAVEWLLTEPHDPHQLEEAILGVIGRIDQPASPAGEARRAYYNELHGRTPEHRNRLRQGVLHVSMDDLKRVAERYLRPELAHTAVVTSTARRDEVEGLGLTVETL